MYTHSDLETKKEAVYGAGVGTYLGHLIANDCRVCAVADVASSVDNMAISPAKGGVHGGDKFAHFLGGA